MANELIKMKTGTIAKLEQKTNNVPDVALDRGTVYFAVDTDTHKGKIVYDAPVGANGVDRIVMSSDSEYADYAREAGKATGITGIYPVKGTQTATTASWTGVLRGIDNLVDGLTIAYYLPTTSANNATLNLTFEDGRFTGAIPVYWTGASRATTHYAAGSTIILTYWSAGSISTNGTATTEARWTRADYDSTNIYQLRHNNGTYLAKSALYRYKILLQDPVSGTTLIPFSSGNRTSATSTTAVTVTTEKFNPFGGIFWYASTSTINANAAISGSAVYQQYNLDIRYNLTITLTNNKDVYLKATPQDDGSAILDATNPIVQALPAEADGKIYIYLGHASSTTAIELHPTHPVYHYKGGKIVLYTGEPLANGTTNGLMSSSDKNKFDSGIGIAGTTVAIGSSISQDTLRENLGLSNALHFLGITTTSMQDDRTTATVSINGNNVTAAAGDVVISNDTHYEYVWVPTGTNAGRWERLGPDGSYALSNHTHTLAKDAGTNGSGFMTNEESVKLTGIQGGAQVNVLESVKMNNTALTITSKAVNIPLMTGASANAAGGIGLVPAPAQGAQGSFLRGDGTWAVPQDTQYPLVSGSNDGLMTSALYNRLMGIAEGAQPGTVTSVGTGVGLTGGTITGSGTIKAKLRSETKLTRDSAAATETADRVYPVVQDKSGYLAVNVPWNDTQYPLADGNTNGLMSSSLYNRLMGMDIGANNYTHPSHTQHSSGLYKITVDEQGHVSAATAVTKSDITDLGIPAQDTTTDEKVKQLAAITTAGEYPVLLGYNTSSTQSINAVNKVMAITANPSTGTVSAKKFRVDEAVTLEYNSTTKSLDFIFA